MYIHMYIYIYIYMCVCISLSLYIYIYIYIVESRPSGKVLCLNEKSMVRPVHLLRVSISEGLTQANS